MTWALYGKIGLAEEPIHYYFPCILRFVRFMRKAQLFFQQGAHAWLFIEGLTSTRDDSSEPIVATALNNSISTNQCCVTANG